MELCCFFAEKQPSELWPTDSLSQDILAVPAPPMAAGKPEGGNKASGAGTALHPDSFTSKGH